MTAKAERRRTPPADRLPDETTNARSTAPPLEQPKPVEAKRRLTATAGTMERTTRKEGEIFYSGSRTDTEVPAKTKSFSECLSNVCFTCKVGWRWTGESRACAKRL